MTWKPKYWYIISGIGAALILLAVALLFLQNFTQSSTAQRDTNPGLLAFRASPSPNPQSSPVPTSNAAPSSTTSTPPQSTIASYTPPALELESFELSGGSHVYQTFNNCGPAALHMTFSYFDTDISQMTLGDQLRPFQNPAGNNDDKSVTLTEIAARAEDEGFVTYHRAAGSIELIESLVAQNIPVVARTWLTDAEEIGHFRVVVGFDRDTGELIQDDSLQGDNLRYGYEAFEKLWEPFSREFLIIVPPEKQAAAERILGPYRDWGWSWQLALQQAQQRLAEDPAAIWPQFNKSVAQYHLGNFEASLQEFDDVQPQLPSRTLWYRAEPLYAAFMADEYRSVMSLSEQIFSSQNRAFSELYALRAAIFEEQNNPAAAATARERARTYNRSNYWLENLPASASRAE